MFLFDCRRPRMETHLQIEAFDDAGAVAIILVPTAGSHLVHVVVVVFIVIGMRCLKLQESRRRRRKGRMMSKKMEVGPRRRGFGGNNVRVLWISQLMPNQVSRSLNSHSKKYLRHYLQRTQSVQLPTGTQTIPNHVDTPSPSNCQPQNAPMQSPVLNAPPLLPRCSSGTTDHNDDDDNSSLL